jgi:hypothetical protein
MGSCDAHSKCLTGIPGEKYHTFIRGYWCGRRLHVETAEE